MYVVYCVQFILLALSVFVSSLGTLKRPGKRPRMSSLFEVTHFYPSYIFIKIDNNVMEMKDHVILTLRCHGL